MWVPLLNFDEEGGRSIGPTFITYKGSRVSLLNFEGVQGSQGLGPGPTLHHVFLKTGFTPISIKGMQF